MPRDPVERYLHIRRATSPTLGPSGERLAFLYDASGVPQVWTLDSPGSWPEQVTFGSERVTAVEWSPVRGELAITTDVGGNERDQLLRVGLTAGSVSRLTDHPEAIHVWGGWSHDGDRFAYAANRRDRSAFDIYVQGRDEADDAARRLLVGERELFPAGWSPDDERLVVLEVHASFDADLHVVDVATGDARHVTPHEGEVRFGPVAWGPAGDALYVVTDADADTRYAARLDLDSLELDAVVGADEWSVEGLALDAETGRLAVVRNVDGYAELTMGRLTGPTGVESIPAPDLPEGVVSGLSFGPDGDRLVLTAEGRRDTADVYVVDAVSGNSTRWTRASTAGLPRSAFVAPSLLRFETFDGRQIPAFYSVPDGSAGAGGDPTFDRAPGNGWPVIVDIHGGPESQRRPGFLPRVQLFLDAGYAVFEPNVRGSTGYGAAYSRLDDVRGRLDSVADVAAGVEWLRDRDEIDPDRVVAYGRSYGGFMVLSALTEYPELWAAGVDVVGIANFVTFLERTGEWRRARREAEYGSLADDREFLEAISPLTNIDAIRAPLLVLHGANDPRVPVGEADQVVSAAADHVPVERLVFDDEGHGFSKLENRLAAARATLAFLDEHV